MSFTENYFGKKTKQVLMQIYPELSISNKGIQFLYLFFSEIRKIMNDSISLLKKYDKHSIEDLIKCILTGTNELAIHAIKNMEIYETVFTGQIWDTHHSLVDKYFSTTLEYILAEVLELSGNVTKDNQKKRITPYYIWYSISLDEELLVLFKKIGFDQYKFEKEELIKNRPQLNNFLYYHTKNGQIYKMKKEELFDIYKDYL